MRSLRRIVYAEYIWGGTPHRRTEKVSYINDLAWFRGWFAFSPAVAQFLQKVFNLKRRAKAAPPASHLPHKNPFLSTQPTF